IKMFFQLNLKKVLVLIFIFYLFALIETSFLVHFNIFFPKLRWYPNLILLSVIFLSFFERPEGFFAFLAAICGGFFWDIFSTSFIGFHILILVAVTLLIKIILGRYVGFSFSKKF
ncbi:hypothetical protein J7K44_02405, partial [bacterium]|nr:hypothetical protein [bacterium]